MNEVAKAGSLPAHTETAASCCVPLQSRSGALAESTLNAASPLSHDNMVELDGGEFLMGTDYAQGFPADGEGPVRSVQVQSFRIDVTPVTNEQFAEFARKTNYITEAERFGWSFVFWSQIPRERIQELVEDTVAQAPWWCKVPGAAWNHPYGPQSEIAAILDHPVVHVSWNDARAYASWTGKRLPKEAEWEYAARGGLVQKLFPWGDELVPGGIHRCNVWQGSFPHEDTAEDGFSGTCPVRTFLPNDFGIYSVVGNVWEWCAEPFRTDHSAPLTQNLPGVGRVMKGGSFLCHASYCNRYRVAARTQNSPDSSTSNIGFRCAL